MAALKFPYTPTRGRLAGRTFATNADYKAALASASLDSSSSAGDAAPARTSPATPKIQYSRAMVEAVVHMIGGALSFTPLFRGDNNITKEEYDWLIGDWYAFGKRHPFFARLIVQMFSVDLYGQLALDHIIIVGARLVATKRLPDTMVFPLQMAVIARQAMAGEIGVSVESEPEPSPEPMAPGGSPGVGGGDEYGQDLFSAPPSDASSSYDYVLHQTR